MSEKVIKMVHFFYLIQLVTFRVKSGYIWRKLLHFALKAVTFRVSCYISR